MEIIAYEMKYIKNDIEKSNILCIPFEQKYFQQYMKIYNTCFYEMRKFLAIEPYNFLNDYKQVREKSKDIFLLVSGEEIIGSIACYGNEIDDLIVNKEFQNRGYGKQLLLWGMNYIRQTSNEPILLHVAKWNDKAFMLYKKVGFVLTNTVRVR
ncbi:GNAT family N-acetyltransferase [bacterium 1xD8-48]|nr:GNAT family N-acetyltransferase [bacterium 1XD42-76]NBJ96673.1 GNAT family N-acetyltransferase [bacterium 1xD8-48]NBK06536.1 GNAT family N-acetyltransferase [bacterium 1XD42-94]